jgi:hypothetical protein
MVELRLPNLMSCGELNCVELVMLQRLEMRIAFCLERADDANRLAASAPTLAMKSEYEEMARSWRLLSRSLQFAETLECFLLDGDARRRGQSS